MAQFFGKPFRLLQQNDWLCGLAVTAAGLFGAAYLGVAFSRVFYPYDLDFIEDGILMTALRLARNQPIFGPPTADFAPHVYMPLYPWLGSLLFRITGPNFWTLRLISLTATLTTAGLIFFMARRESRQGWLGAVCTGLFLGGYRVTGFIFELARVDALAVALSLAGMAEGIYAKESRRGQIGAGLLLALAFWAKQTGGLVGAALGLYLLLARGRQSWPFWLTFLGLTIPPAAALNAVTGGWFFYYTVEIAGANPIEPGRIANFLGPELVGAMGGLTVMAIGAAWLHTRHAGLRNLWRAPWLMMIVAAVIISGLGRASVGGNINNRLPAYALLCLAPALLWTAWAYNPRLPGRLLLGIVTVLALAQFALGIYNPWKYVATFSMRNQGEALIRTIAAEQGEVLVMMHPYYATLAGKAPSAQIAALWHARRRGQQPLPADLTARLQSGYYRAIISDESLFETEPALSRLLEKHYTPARHLSPDEAPPTSAGMVVWPAVVYRAKN